jgi:hypothetical protein
MKNTYKLYLSIAVALLFHYSLYSQNTQAVSLGKCADVLNTLNVQIDKARQVNDLVDLKISSTSSLKGKVNFKKSEDGNNQFIVGKIDNVPASNFYLNIGANFLEGTVILQNEKRAYKYYNDSQGNAFVKEVNINEVVCIDYHKDGASAQKTESTNAVQYLYNLESLHGANGCVLLDFDGQYVSGTPWNGGAPINASPSGMTDAQIKETWEVVSEDFRPFSVNITTNETVFNSYPQNRRMRVVVTPTDVAAPGAGGVAYIGSFSWTNDTPCWVFVLGSGKNCGEAASHEVGHTFSLLHDGRITPAEGYFAGHGDWAPIMGVGYYRSVTQWSKGEYASANNTEDDLTKIASPTHGCGYRADDHGNTIATARAMVVTSTGNVSAASNSGFIGGTTDVDVFTFATGGGAVSLKFNPAITHPDLDIIVRLYNEAGILLATYNPAGLSVDVNITLASGRYYAFVDGTGVGNPATDGYSDYASLGVYSISGYIPQHCIAKGGTSFEFIDNVNLGSINNTSGNNSGYADFTALSTTLIRGSTRTINLRTGFVSGVYAEKWAVWIDYNRDGDFADAGETVVTTTSSGAAAVAASFTIPAGAALGRTRMRVAMRFDATPLPCGIYSYGEVEDYSVDIFLLIPLKTTEAQASEKEEMPEINNLEPNIYPNPVQDMLTIDNINVEGNVVSTIYDISGKEMKTFAVTAPSFHVDLSELPAGMYFINIRSEKNNINKRIIKN